MAGVQKAQRVVLIGFMGAGKTSVGKKLAQELGWRFVDLDDVIESRSQNSVSEIFATAGEKRFRELETEALDFLLGQSNEDMVLALGGGAFVQPANRALLDRAAAATVLLQAPVEELHRRCRLDGRERLENIALGGNVASQSQAAQGVSDVLRLGVVRIDATNGIFSVNEGLRPSTL